MNDVREFSVPPAQLSCLIGNLFAELEPPCSEPDDPEALKWQLEQQQLFQHLWHPPRSDGT